MKGLFSPLLWGSGSVDEFLRRPLSGPEVGRGDCLHRQRVAWQAGDGWDDISGDDLMLETKILNVV